MSIKTLYNFNVDVPGELGIEIEIEGKNLPHRLEKWWRVTNDGSLRGEEAYEYVLSSPVKRGELADALSYLEAAMRRKKSIIEETGRAGTHVHVNVLDMEVEHVRNFIALYQILEEPLIKWCGPAREGNLFCLRGKDAEGLVELLIDNMRSYFWNFSADHCKYAALNLSALPRYGSLEFRSMKSTIDMSLIKTWAEMLLKIKDAAPQFASPRAIVEGLSGEGEIRFLRMIMGAYEELLMFSGVEQMLRNGARLVQNWAYVTEERKQDVRPSRRHRNPSPLGRIADRPLRFEDILQPPIPQPMQQDIAFTPILFVNNQHQAVPGEPWLVNEAPLIANTPYIRLEEPLPQDVSNLWVRRQRDNLETLLYFDHNGIVSVRGEYETGRFGINQYYWEPIPAGALRLEDEELAEDEEE